MSKPCISCRKLTDIRISPDLDIEGIYVCQDCKDDVKLSLLLVILGDRSYEWFEKKYKIKKS